MTISIGTVTLSDDLVWENEFASPRIGQSIKTTIGGTTVVHTDPKAGGRVVQLVAARRNNAIYGFFTRSQIQSLETYQKNGTVVAFVYGSETFNVVIRAGGINVQPLLAKQGQGVDDYYTGTITMVEV